MISSRPTGPPTEPAPPPGVETLSGSWTPSWALEDAPVDVLIPPAPRAPVFDGLDIDLTRADLEEE